MKSYLNWKVLIINTSGQPIRIAHWTKAILLIYLGKADAVSYYKDTYIHSQFKTIHLPNIINLKKYVKGQIIYPKFNRENVFIRDKYICQYCGIKENPKKLTIDHVVPKSLGGKKNWTNIVTCCIPCNQKKANKTIEISGMSLIKKPFKLKKLSLLSLKQNDPKEWKSYF